MLHYVCPRSAVAILKGTFVQNLQQYNSDKVEIIKMLILSLIIVSNGKSGAAARESDI